MLSRRTLIGLLFLALATIAVGVVAGTRIGSQLRGQASGGTSCTDSDGGYDPMILGTLSFKNGTHQETHTDYCLDQNKLYEFGCAYNDYLNRLDISAFIMDCAAGCANGVCTYSADTSCSDTDGGVVPEVNGKVTVLRSGSYFAAGWDGCETWGTQQYLRENYCTQGMWAYTYIECVGACTDSACQGKAVSSKSSKASSAMSSSVLSSSIASSSSVPSSSAGAGGPALSSVSSAPSTSLASSSSLYSASSTSTFSSSFSAWIDSSSSRISSRVSSVTSQSYCPACAAACGGGSENQTSLSCDDCIAERCISNCFPISSSSSMSSGSSKSSSEISDGSSKSSSSKSSSSSSVKPSSSSTSSAPFSTPTHLACRNKQCIAIIGSGKNECSTKNDCLNVHSVCDAKQCITIQGPGQDACMINADCLSPTHLACRNKQCIAVADSGKNECSTKSDCLNVHSVCDFAQCITTQGPGQDVCMVNVDCEAEQLSLLIRCGNNVIDSEEACDQGKSNSDTLPNHCRTTCQLPACGDGVEDAGEDCDDGNQANGDSCSSFCRLEERLVAAAPLCGNGVLERGEFCDDGNSIDNDGCTASCRLGVGGGCQNDYECGEGKCVYGVCTLLIEGESCAANNQCTSDKCVQGICFAAAAHLAPTSIDFPQFPANPFAAQFSNPSGSWQFYGAPQEFMQYASQQPKQTDTGPAAVVAIAGGAAAGLAWARRRRRSV